ncbi:MAG: inositol monophosphatase [Planctomycetes bacterium]|nr:inositol monophosphatase [Planctomycetota bacterium]
MRSFLVELSKVGGKIAREHFATVAEKDVRSKGQHDYVSHVDRLVEDAIIRRIRSRYPDHQILGEETSGGHPISSDDERPMWIIDPIDGTTNFIHGIPAFAISIAYCEHGEPKDGIVYDPMRDEAFIGEATGGLWLNGDRVATSGCTEIANALLASALPFRFPEAMDDCVKVFVALQRRCDDHRRGGSAALDMAYVAVGRLDGYYELGIHPWDTAAGELLVRCGGGVATDYRGSTGNLTGRRSIVCGATPDLHRGLLDAVKPIAAWLDRAPFAT